MSLTYAQRFNTEAAFATVLFVLMHVLSGKIDSIVFPALALALAIVLIRACISWMCWNEDESTDPESKRL